MDEDAEQGYDLEAILAAGSGLLAAEDPGYAEDALPKLLPRGWFLTRQSLLAEGVDEEIIEYLEVEFGDMDPSHLRPGGAP